MSAHIRARDDAGVRTLTMARAPANILDLALLAELRAAVDAAGADASVRCLVLASGLPKYFSAGVDLEEALSLPEARREAFFITLLETHRALATLPKPTVAAVGGYALLGGYILAMACDRRLAAAETGRVALSEIRLGLSPTTALVARLRHIGGTPRGVHELVVLGRTLKAAEALEAGAVDRVVPSKELEAAALDEARSLAKLAPAAFASVKRSLADSDGHADERLWRASLDEFRRLFSGAEAREGVAAMREKRRPRWG